MYTRVLHLAQAAHFYHKYKERDVTQKMSHVGAGSHTTQHLTPQIGRADVTQKMSHAIKIRVLATPSPKYSIKVEILANPSPK